MSVSGPSVGYSKLGSSSHDVAKIKKKSTCCRLTIFSVSIIFLAFAASIFLFVGIGGSCCFPLHASCSVDWNLTVDCGDVKKAVVEQINLWQTDKNCQEGGEKCLYKLVSESSTQVKATHETPTKHYIDDLTFTFTQTNHTCRVQGGSSSQLWYALLDQGTNYCNLHNLITGAGLDKKAGYSETTDDRRCTQYSSADCEVY